VGPTLHAATLSGALRVAVGLQRRRATPRAERSPGAEPLQDADAVVPVGHDDVALVIEGDVVGAHPPLTVLDDVRIGPDLPGVLWVGGEVEAS